MTTSIRELPEATVSAIRSGITIPTLPAVLLELVQNSLDADSTSIDCSFDLSRWLVRCEDNGCGMTLDALRSIGRYCTSKAGPQGVTTFGFRGEAIASLADLGLLEIHTNASGETCTLLARDGQVLSVGRSATPRHQTGTTVTVRDLFFKWPVRRKSLSGTNAKAGLVATLRDHLARLALVKPEIAFTLTNSEGSPKRLLTLAKSREGILGRWRQLWGRADVERVKQVDIETAHCRVRGFISHSASTTRTQQFLYINSRPAGPSALHKQLGDAFAHSNFVSHAPLAGHSPRKASSRKTSKGDEKYPVYVLDVLVDPALVDVTLDPQKTHVELSNEQDVLNVLQDVASDFLKSEGYSGGASFLKDKPGAAQQASLPFARTKSLDRATPASRKRKFDQTDLPSPSADPATLSQAPIRWTDATSGRVFFVDPRSGHSWLADKGTRSSACSCDDDQFGLQRSQSDGLVDRTRLKRAFVAEEQGARPTWLDGIMSLWDNPAYPPGDKSIKTLSATIESKQTNSHTIALETNQKLTKASLRRAELICQVDDKFLLVRLPAVAGGPTDHQLDTLALIDQHAADERVRVERFFAELTRGDTPAQTELDEPIKVLLTTREYESLDDDARRSFARWGFQITVAAPDQVASEANDYVQIEVVSVPLIVSDRLREANTLQSLIKDHLASGSRHSSNRRDEHNNDTDNDGDQRQSKPSWLRALTLDGPPRMLVDLINSKACRGAIMFNDRLTDDEARRLVASLGETVFPFQCAHARPSLVPLFNVATQGRACDREKVDWDRLYSKAKY